MEFSRVSVDINIVDKPGNEIQLVARLGKLVAVSFVVVSVDKTEDISPSFVLLTGTGLD